MVPADERLVHVAYAVVGPGVHLVAIGVVTPEQRVGVRGEMLEPVLLQVLWERGSVEATLKVTSERLVPHAALAL